MSEIFKFCDSMMIVADYKNLEPHRHLASHIIISYCTGCDLCAKRCPVNNITMVDGKPNWNHHCELCVACIQSCPKKAIDYKGETKKRERYLNPNVKL